ncbi:MAG: MFS transporter, partial [Isosphaeraceae bacterium]
VAALSKPLIGTSASWQQALLGRFLDRLGTGTRSAPRDAMIASSAAEEARGRAFGLESLGDNLGAFVGPLVCVLLLFGAELSIRSVFFLAVIPGLVSVGLVLMVRDRRPAERKLEATRLRVVDLPAAYWRYLLAAGLFGLGNATNALVILRAQNLGLKLETTLLVYAGFNLCASLASLPAGYLSDRVGRKRTLMAAFAIFVVTYAGFALGESVALVAVLLVFFGLFQGTFRAIGKALAADLTPEALMGTGLGIYSATIGLTGLIASIVGGQLWDRVGPAATFWYGATFGLIGLVFLGLLVSPLRERRV